MVVNKIHTAGNIRCWNRIIQFQQLTYLFAQVEVASNVKLSCLLSDKYSP